MRYVHEVDHYGIESTLAKLQTKFWIPTVRKLIRSVKEKCTYCRRLKKVTEGQIMGQLPPERLKPSPPFMNTALDLFGPFMVKDTVKRRTKRKACGVIFNCLSTRAVYIDLVEGYGTKEFLNAFRRFCSIHGYPSKVFSDHGTQLVSANKELRSIMANWNNREIEDFCVGGNCTILWIHNKSADAPWQNGCSEALIKSIKRCLVIAINESILSFSELQTVLFEIANLLNERPIGIKPGCDPELGRYLCPNDLLLGRTFNKAVSGPFLQADYGRRVAFNRKIIESFWKKWTRDFFPTLLIRQKWHVERRSLKVGDIVFFQDNALIGHWKLAEVISVDSNKDNRVRDVTLRYKPEGDGKRVDKRNIIIKRSAHKISLLLPVEERNQ